MIRSEADLFLSGIKREPERLQEVTAPRELWSKDIRRRSTETSHLCFAKREDRCWGIAQVHYVVEPTGKGEGQAYWLPLCSPCAFWLTTGLTVNVETGEWTGYEE